MRPRFIAGMDLFQTPKNLSFLYEVIGLQIRCGDPHAGEQNESGTS